jgi:hypothetical protein
MQVIRWMGALARKGMGGSLDVEDRKTAANKGFRYP